MKNIVVCRCKNCTEKSRELNKDDAIKVGNSYYHKSCYKTEQEIKEIIDLFVKNINPNPVFTTLRNVINQIVFQQNLGSEFLLFGLRYYIDHRIPLNYPQGLYYVIQNKTVQNEYAKKTRTTVKTKVEIAENSNKKFSYTPTKQVGFADIFGESR